MRKVFQTIKKLSQLPDWLNWLLSVVEPLLVLGIGGMLCYIAYRFVFIPEQRPQDSQLLSFIKAVSDNWKAGLILLLVLFYRTIRVFLEQVEKGPLGMERRKPLQTQEPEQLANPVQPGTHQQENKSPE